MTKEGGMTGLCVDGHPLLAFGIGHFFDGIAEHGARHFVGMLVEEVAEEVHGASFAHLS